ncbi:MAG: ATP-binding protein [Oculatellaceae cyanobacterium Prado106]|jgi:hypothetical protein|nr:ATP-binding protein [Oculatellaceae cyanobacterium Prado106]
MIVSTIQAQVSSATLGKVSRLFNASLTDCLNELLQNARRAGATGVSLSLTDDRHLTIADDGIGIANPQTLLTLGQSDWSSQTQQQEDPAGMGIFSLASRNVTVRSQDWQVHLTPEHFSGGAIAPVEFCGAIAGTEIGFTLTDVEARSLHPRVQQVARFYPLPVWLNGEEISREDFLHGALYVEEWQGLRIGVRSQSQWQRDWTINFYGLTLGQVLPSLCCNTQTYYVRVDVLDCPDLKLVLPARKEVVQDAFWTALTQELRRVLYRFVATLPHHNLAYTQWQKAKALGVDLPMAQAVLYSFGPAIANVYENDRGIPEAIADNALVFDIRDFSCSQQQVFWRAFEQANLAYQPLAPDVNYIGYPWYDRLPRLSQVRFEVEQAGVRMDLETWAEGRSRGGVERVTQVWAIAQMGDGSSYQEMRFPSDLVLVDDPDCDFDPVEQTLIVLSESARLEVEELAELLEVAYFVVSDDSDSDSWYTQQQDFQESAYERAARALLNEQAALLARLTMAAERHLRWMVPPRQKLEIRLVPSVGNERSISVTVGEQES